MLNLYDTDDDRILFEINKANIFERHIEISDKILLTGGTEVDIIELYLQAKHELEESDKIIKDMELKQEKLKAEITEMESKSRALENIIKDKNNLIDSQIHEQLKLKEIIYSNQKEIYYQKKLMSNDADQLNRLREKLKNNKEQIEKQKLEYHQETAKLIELKDEIRRRNVELQVQEKTLGEQYGLIRKQKQIELLFIIITFLGISMAFFLFSALRYRKRKTDC